jgi:hypothetical protein
MTGDNESYLGLHEKAIISSKSYQTIPENLIVNRELSDDEKIYGISRTNSDPYYVILDKGGIAVSEDAQFANYFVKSDYLINWSKESVDNLKDNNGLRNLKYYFKKGLVYSEAGVNCPTFRLNSTSVFAKASPCIFINYFSVEQVLGILCSKLSRFIFKNYINNTVHVVMGDIPELPIALNLNNLAHIVEKIIFNQKSNPRYDYASHEQIEIDKLVYQAYGLNAEDVQEVENWYARRYTKLSAAQKANLRALDKSDDYLELYGMK